MKKFKNSAIVKAAASMSILIIIAATILLQLSAPAYHAHAAPAVTFTDFPLPNGSYASQITKGPDGNLWFDGVSFSSSNSYLYFIGRITPAGTTTQFPLPKGTQPEELTSGPDGNIWYTEGISGFGPNGSYTVSKIARITPIGVITEFSLPTSYSVADDITNGPDGNLWFTDSKSNKIGRISTHGLITEFSIPTVNSNPFYISKGPDGNLWFTEYAGNKIGRITPKGNITEFPHISTNLPTEITSGPDGNLWFTEQTVNTPLIGRITPKGVVTEFPVPANGISTNRITHGPDGNVWFTMVGNGGMIGYITPTGSATLLTPPNNSGSWDITNGPDGNVWFTGFSSSVIVRVNLKPQTYLALGDSYSSGEGNPPFSADLDCHRSNDAWPFLLANSDVRLFLLGNYACSGAKASNSLTQSYNPCSLLFQFRKCPQAPQISVMKSLKPNIVTITIGGNDIGFAQTLEICYAAGIDHRQYLCDAWLHYEAWVINNFEKAAISYYKEIKAALPNTSKVYIVGYPNLFPTNQKYTTHCGWLSNAGRVEFNNLAILLDKNLHDAVNTAGVNYISTLYALKGHELCTSNSWVNPILPKDTLIGDDYHNDGHPTFAGQEAMETMVDAGIFG